MNITLLFLGIILIRKMVFQILSWQVPNIPPSNKK